MLTYWGTDFGMILPSFAPYAGELLGNWGSRLVPCCPSELYPRRFVGWSGGTEHIPNHCARHPFTESDVTQASHTRDWIRIMICFTLYVMSLPVKALWAYWLRLHLLYIQPPSNNLTITIKFLPVGVKKSSAHFFQINAPWLLTSKENAIIASPLYLLYDCGTIKIFSFDVKNHEAFGPRVTLAYKGTF